jgi:outer membrane protein assembly factor BamB
MKIRVFVRVLGMMLAAGGAMSLGGCESGGDRYDSQTQGAPTAIADRDAAFDVAADSYNTVGYRLDWRGYPVVVPGEGIQRVLVYPDALVVQETGSNVTVMEPSNGSVRWSIELATRLTRIIGMDRSVDGRYGNVLAAATDAEVYLLSTATGTLVARQPLEKVSNTGPLVMGNLAMFGTATGELLAHQFTNNVKMWGVDTTGTFEQPPVAIGTSVVGAVSSTGQVVFVDVGLGRMVGRAMVFDGPGAPPVSNGQAMFVASLDQSLYAFAPNGSRLWRHRTAERLMHAPTAIGQMVCCTTDKGLQAFDATSGTVIWTAADVRGTVVGKRKTNLLVWDGKVMSLVDEQRGDLIEQVTLPGVRSITMSAFEDGDMYVASWSGVLAKYVTK